MTYRIAVGTEDFIHVTEHFGRCRQAMILEVTQETGDVAAIETRSLPSSAGCGAGHDPVTVAAKIEALSDCRIILMAKIGGQSEKQLIHRGFIALQFEGRIDDALARIHRAYRARVFQSSPMPVQERADHERANEKEVKPNV